MLEYKKLIFEQKYVSMLIDGLVRHGCCYITNTIDCGLALHHPYDIYFYDEAVSTQHSKSAKLYHS